MTHWAISKLIKNISPISTGCILIFLCLMLVLTSLTLKIIFLANSELMIDQAHYSWWIKSMIDQKNIFPESGLINIKADPFNFLHQLLIRIYNDPFRLFNIVSVAMFYPLVAIFSNGWIGFNLASIIYSNFLSLTIAYFALTIVNPKIHQKYFFSLLAIGVATTQHYLYYFSYLGMHVVGSLFYLLFLAQLNSFLHSCRCALPYKKKASLFIVIALAIYAHWTNLLLVPVTIIISLVFTSSISWREKFRKIGKLIAYIMILVIPFFILIKNLHNFDLFYYSGVGSKQSLDLYLERGVIWLQKTALLATLPWLMLGIFGAYVAMQRYSAVLMAAIFSHFLLATFVPSFSGFAYLRTFVYLLPVLLTASICAILFTYRKKYVNQLIWVLAVVGVVINSQLIYNQDLFNKRNPDFFNEYHACNGTLKNAVEKASAMLIKKKVIYGDYYARDLFCGFRTNISCNLPALNSLVERSSASNAEFSAYLLQRGIDLNQYFKDHEIIISIEPLKINELKNMGLALSNYVSPLALDCTGMKGLNIYSYKRY